MLYQDIREFHRPNRRGYRARMVRMRPFEQAVGRFRFLSNDRQQKSLGVGPLPQAPCSHRSSSQTQANSSTRIGDASERDLQARYTWRFCSFQNVDTAPKSSQSVGHACRRSDFLGALGPDGIFQALGIARRYDLFSIC